MFRIKICGVTRPDDAVAALRLGADCIGLNFYPRSSRFVERSAAAKIVQVVPRETALAGVYVDADVEVIRRDAEQFRLGWIQLHGGEPPECIAELDSLRCIKAFRIDHRGMAPVMDYLARCESLGRQPEAVLLDTYRAGQLGGTGATFDWSVVESIRCERSWFDTRGATAFPAIVLAGGLTPENVTEAIVRVRPTAVDTASGVESAPGIKDPEKIARFVAAARSAWESLE